MVKTSGLFAKRYACRIIEVRLAAEYKPSPKSALSSILSLFIYLTEYKSRLRILKSAASLYPILHSLLRAVYVTINSLRSVSKLDEALKSGPVREEVHSCLPQC